jgi:hypothetical protein
MKTQLIATNTCPQCGAKKITLNKHIGKNKYLPRIFRCKHCDADLNGKPTWQVLWILPVSILYGVAVNVLFDWLDRYSHTEITLPTFISGVLFYSFWSVIAIALCYISFRLLIVGSRFSRTHDYFVEMADE